MKKILLVAMFFIATSFFGCKTSCVTNSYSDTYRVYKWKRKNHEYIRWIERETKYQYKPAKRAFKGANREFIKQK